MLRCTNYRSDAVCIEYVLCKRRHAQVGCKWTWHNTSSLHEMDSNRQEFPDKAETFYVTLRNVFPLYVLCSLDYRHKHIININACTFFAMELSLSYSRADETDTAILTQKVERVNLQMLICFFEKMLRYNYEVYKTS